MGTPEFAVPCLQALVDGGHEVIAVFTQPDKPKGRGNRLTPPPVKVLAEKLGIPVYQPERIRRESVGLMEELAPDLCVTAAFGQILSQRLLDIPRLGCVNVHASLLPRHRGSAPINWAILQGDEKAGVTTMMMARGVDAGDMLLKCETPIRSGETAGELTERLSQLGAPLLMETISALESGTLRRIPQNENEMTYDPMLDKRMGIIDWTRDARDIVNQIHGLNPWPGASTALGGQMVPAPRLKLHRAEEAEGAGQPGEVLQADAKQGLVIACGRGAVRILQLQAPGGKPMAARDYLRGHPMAVGTVLKEEEA